MGGIGDIFWLFLILSLLQPIVRQKLLEAGRMRLIRRIERERNHRVIVLIHRQETMSLLGFPVMRYIDINDAEEVIRAIQMTDPGLPIDLVLHTPGGLVLASLQIARALKAHEGKVTVFVPHYAMSGGTLIALAADEIVMDPHAVLGPVDPQLGEYPAASLVRVVRQKNINEVDDRTLILADIAEKALEQIRREVLELLPESIPHDRAQQIAEKLTQGTWTHDHPISFAEAKEMGLPVCEKMPREFYELMELFPQPVRGQASVQYIPVPYGPAPTPRGNGR